MGCMTYKYLRERGADVVAVFNRKSHLGEDAGVLAGIGKTDLAVQAITELENTLQSQKVDIALLLHTSLMTDVEPVMTTCIMNGIDCFTIAEDLLYPYGTETLKEPAKRLDELAKKHGVTITAGGYNDTLWCWLVPILSSVAHDMKEIHITCVLNIDQYMRGTPGFAQILFPMLFGMGKTLKEFDAQFTPMNEDPKLEPGRIAGTVSQWLAEFFGWKVETHRQYFSPTTAKSKVFSFGLQTKIPSGKVTGCKESTVTTTTCGKKIMVDMTCKSYMPGEEDISEVKIKGNPTVCCTIKPGNVAEFTCLSSINRIPDVLQAKAGYIITKDLPPPKYVEDLSYTAKKSNSSDVNQNAEI